MRISKLTKHQFAIFGVSLLAITIIAGLSSPAFAEPKSKIVMCHQGDLGPETIRVSGNAKDAHLGHGDTLGACGDETDPPAPTLISPDDAFESRIVSGNILFSWSDVDDESGIDHYTLEVLDSGNNVVYLNDDINDDDDDGAEVADLSVGEHFWHVRATDGAGNVGAFSDTFSFIVNNDSSPPPAPTLLTPADNAVIDRSETTSILFEWALPFDESGIGGSELRVLDSEGQVKYIGGIDEDNDDDNGLDVADLSDGVHFWNVKSTDGVGIEGPFAAVSFSFTVVP